MAVCIRLLLAFATVIGFHDVIATNALTETEIQIFIDNGFNITTDEITSTITIEHHGLPDHEFEGGWGDNPNTAGMVNHSFTLPLMATVAVEKGCAGRLGPIGIAISGGAFYNPYTGFGYNAVEGDCAEDLDECKGHPSPDSTYHYHGIPNCLYTGDLRDKFLGVALDGYPIYGPMDKTGKNWTTSQLDICHGHYYEDRYVYRATYDFPYILGCFHGNDVKSDMQNNRPLQNGGERPMNGAPPSGRPPINGGNGGACRQSTNPDWQRSICHVECQNPAVQLVNCTLPTSGETSVFRASSTTQQAITLGLVFTIMCTM